MSIGQDVGALTWVLSPGALLADSSESDDLWDLAIGPGPGRYCVYQANRACPEEHFLDRYAASWPTLWTRCPATSPGT
jgi:hypothetical protein